MTEGQTEASPRGRDLRAALADNLDVTVAFFALFALVAAIIVHPTEVCGSGAHPTALFKAFALVSCLSFLVASFLAFVSRKHIVAKFAGFLFGLLVTLIAAIALVAAGSPTGFGDSGGERPTLQSELRRLAAPGVGKHAYWLGREFREVSVDSTQGYWAQDELGQHVDLVYSRVDVVGEPDVNILVRSYRGPATQAPGDDLGPSEIVHTRSGQDVRIEDLSSIKANAALMAEARAAVQAIPRDVEYSGCDG